MIFQGLGSKQRSVSELGDGLAAFPIVDVPAEVRSERPDDVLSAVTRALARAEEETTGLGKRSRSRDPRERLVRRLLPVLDGFDQVFRFGAQSGNEGDEVLQNWMKALKGISRHLYSALEKEGLMPIPSVGERLDLNVHDVVDVRETLEETHDTIVEEVERGYEYNGRVLRDARVIVARRAK